MRKKSVREQPTLENYNLVFKLRKEGMMYKDIAFITGFNKDTIRHWVSRGVKPQSIWMKEDWDNRKEKINTEERSEKIRQSKLGNRNPMWRGNKASKSAARKRARRAYDCPLLKWLKLERHHIDNNPWNNDPNNIKFTARKEHMIIDGRLEKFLIMAKNGELKRGIGRGTKKCLA